MLARVRSAAVLGIDAYLVDVETDIANGLPTFATVGLPQGAVKEGRERVYAAVANTGYTFPLKRITVNLAPADVRKDGSAFDLPIAIGILAATNQISGERLARFVGREVDVLIDRVADPLDGGATHVGRVQWQADDVDGVTALTNGGWAQPGTFVRARLVASADYDFEAVALP